jgi:uncharacterized protein YmfQ (DUF2313 family)
MARDYVSEFQALLPSGAAWPRATDAVATELARGLTAEFARVDDRAAQLLLEMDPRTTTELIADWERIAGLPDPCADSAPSDLAGRRAAVTARIIARGAGGPSVTFLTDVVAALGYDRAHIVIRRFAHQPFTCESACVDELNPETAGWMYLWEIVALHGNLDLTLICQVTNRYALSHLALTFAFPLFYFGDGDFSRAGSGVLTDPETGEQTTLAADTLGTFYFGV